MTDHLPECPMLDERYPKHPLEKCDYCEMLRACEQRVFQEQIKGRQHDMVMAYLRGLDAAREAVERVSSLLQPLGPALAAIDTLINPPSLPPTTGRAHKY